MDDPWTLETLRSGDLELICLPGVGGRLWDVRYKNTSLLFENDDLTGRLFDLEALQELPTRSPQFKFPLWGGEKTWIAPDRDWIYDGPHRVLDSGAYAICKRTDTQLHMRSDICPDSRLQIERRIKLQNAASWSITHCVQNMGRDTRFTGIWSVMMLPLPCKIGVHNQHSDDPQPVFGEAAEMVQSSDPGIVANCDRSQEFKVGLQNTSGRTLIRLGAAEDPIWMTIDTPPPKPADTFAHARNFEVFNSGDYAYCEAEWHSPAVDLAAGASMTFEQVFTVGSEDQLFSNGHTTLTELELSRCMSS